MSDIINKFKKLFIQEDAQQTEQGKAEVTADTTASPATQTTQDPYVAPVSTGNTQGEPDNRFLDILMKAVSDNNVNGFDYFEFKNTLQSLSKMNMDDKTRYSSAFAMAQSLGATKPKLVETANFYIEVLRKEEAKFGQALENQKSAQIGNRENELKQLNQLIIDKEEQIKKIQEEINAHKEMINKTSSEIQSAGEKMEKTKNDFNVSYRFVISQMQTDIENITKYIDSQG